MSRFINWFWSSTANVDRSEIENVCFKGGGMKGNAFVGVDKAFTELGLWPQIRRFIGSSAGAIFAGAAACRIEYPQLCKVVEGTDYSKFKDSSWGVVGEGVNLFDKMGLYNGDYFFNWYGKLLQDSIGDCGITLQGVYDRFGSELVITTTDLTMKKTIYMDRHNYPNLQLRDAVRRSMSIPAFFVPIIEVDNNGIKHVLVDGGCTNNFPLNYFDNLYSTKDIALRKTIGFDLDDNNQGLAKIDNIIELVTSLVNTTVEVIEQVRITAADEYRIIKIDTTGYSTTNFDMKRDDITTLANAGYSSTMKFFADLE